MPESLPPIPPDGSQLDYLVKAVTWLTAESITHTEKLESIMATQAELQAKLDEQTTAMTAHRTAVQTQIQQVSDAASQILALIEELRAGAVTQAQIDALAANTQELISQTTAMGSDDAPAPQPLPPANP